MDGIIINELSLNGQFLDSRVHFCPSIFRE